MSDKPNKIDREFECFFDFIKERDLLEIKGAIIQNLNYFKSTNNALYNNSINYFNKYKLWGTYNPDKLEYDLVKNRAEALVEHREDFEWLYNLLCDQRSKRILVNILNYWLMSNVKKIKQIYDPVFDQYFDLDIVKCREDEVFVDIGAYIGDTLINYSKNFGNNCYKRIYCYEIVPKNIEYIEKNISLHHLDRVTIRQKGASSKAGTMFFSNNEISSISQLSDTGEHSVPTVKIDDDIEEEVTFIKMDIEGGEEQALYGCFEKIRKYHPKLALSVYHNHKDLWKLPRLIYDLDPTYHFYLRYYGGQILPTEYIIYAI